MVQSEREKFVTPLADDYGNAGPKDSNVRPIAICRRRAMRAREANARHEIEKADVFQMDDPIVSQRIPQAVVSRISGLNNFVKGPTISLIFLRIFVAPKSFDRRSIIIIMSSEFTEGYHDMVSILFESHYYGSGYSLSTRADMLLPNEVKTLSERIRFEDVG